MYFGFILACTAAQRTQGCLADTAICMKWVLRDIRCPLDIIGTLHNREIQCSRTKSIFFRLCSTGKTRLVGTHCMKWVLGDIRGGKGNAARRDWKGKSKEGASENKSDAVQCTCIFQFTHKAIEDAPPFFPEFYFIWETHPFL